jgi:hypothetical protein
MSSIFCRFPALAMGTFCRKNCPSPFPRVPTAGCLSLHRTANGDDDEVYEVHADDGRCFGHLSRKAARAVAHVMDVPDRCCSVSAVATEVSSRSVSGWVISVTLTMSSQVDAQEVLAYLTTCGLDAEIVGT